MSKSAATPIRCFARRRAFAAAMALFFSVAMPTVQAGNLFKDIQNGLDTVAEVVNDTVQAAGEVVEGGLHATGDVAEGTLRLGAEGVSTVAEPVATTAGAVMKPVADGIAHVLRETAKPIDSAVQEGGEVTEGLAHAVGDVAEGAMKDMVVPIVSDLGERVTDEISQVATYVGENPDYLLLAAVVVGVGWAACYDGCVVVGQFLLPTTGGAVAVDVFTYEPEESEPKHPAVTSEPEMPAPVEDAPDDRFEGLPPASLVKQYPRYYDRVEFPGGPPSATVYRSLDESLNEVFNEFAPPVYPPAVRRTTPYDEGGDFESRRGGHISDYVAGRDAEMRRVHGALDFLAVPGQKVFAPLTGEVTAARESGSDPGYYLVDIESKDFTTARTLYLDSDIRVSVGDQVLAGRTQIGTSKDINLMPKYRNTPKHVHVQFEDGYGRRIDPFTGKFAAPKGSPLGPATFVRSDEKEE